MFNPRAPLFLLIVLTLLWPAASGCHHEPMSVQRSERIEESEPQMVAPGRERVVE